MKPLHTVRLLLLILSVGIFSCSSSKYASTGTSEYDDLYFNKGDRYPVMTNGTTTVIQSVDPDGGVGVGYNSKTLNPDYGLPQDAVVENDYAEDEYYVEDHDDQYMDKAIDDYLRNNSTAKRYSNPRYYRDFDDVFWSDPMYYSGTIFDPLYRSYYGVYSPFAYGSYYRPYSSFYRPWGPRISFNIGFGYGYGPYWNRYYDPFYYGGFGYGYGYYSPYTQYYGSAWCPPSYYGGVNNTVVINSIESANTGTVRYGTRQSRGSSYIVNNSPATARTATSTSERTIRSRADNVVRSSTQGTLENNRVSQGDVSNIRTRNLDSYNQTDGSGTRFRTHSLDSKTSYGANERNNSSTLEQRNRINRGTYSVPETGNSTRRSLDRRSNYSSSPTRSSGSGQFKPNRSAASDGVRSRSNYSRSSAPSRNYSSPSRSNTTSPSRNFSSPSRSRSYSTPSRSNYSSPSRSSSVSPNRSSSMPSRSSGARSITR